MRAKFDPKSSIYDNWLKAEPLDSAWFHFAQKELQDQYRDAGRNPSHTAALYHQMKVELIYSLSNDNSLIAVGVICGKGRNPEPERIAKSYFAADHLEIDWHKNEICAFDEKIASVRILVAESTTIQKKTSTASIDSKPGNSKGGRKSTYPAIREILLDLFEQNEIYRTASSESLVEPVNEAFLNRHTNTSVRVAPISSRTLRNHLTELRKELAETGKN
ncbi:MAG: hypothetical protein AAGE37_03650 [Pseudomonadota bacterium]